LLSSLLKKFAEITLVVVFLDQTLMPGIVNKIINNFDNKWMRFFFHEPYFLKHCLLLSVILQAYRNLRPFNSKNLLIMFSNCNENMSEAALSD
jgi:hypothetical protein